MIIAGLTTCQGNYVWDHIHKTQSETHFHVHFTPQKQLYHRRESAKSSVNFQKSRGKDSNKLHLVLLYNNTHTEAFAQEEHVILHMPFGSWFFFFLVISIKLRCPQKEKKECEIVKL